MQSTILDFINVKSANRSIFPSIAKTADVTSVEAMDGMSTCTCSIAEEVKEFCGSRRFPSGTDAASLQFGEARIYMEPTDVFLIKIRRKEL